MSDKKIGFTCGAFDIVHPGHVRLLRESKANCDYLIVGLQTDPTIDRPDTKNKPIQSSYIKVVILLSEHLQVKLISTILLLHIWQLLAQEMY